VHPGQRIGKYVLGDRIAVGGMAEVWAARAEGPEGFIKPVALKFILESFSGDPELESLFVKEARIAAQLQHANLVAVFDFDKVIVDPLSSAPARYYIAMEHVEGYDARRVAEAARHAGYVFPVGVALYLAGEVLKGLRYVHERREHGQLLGLVHRDVSPHNVLVGFSGEVKLSDFGIAKSLAHSSRTKTGAVRGKLSYASPEQLNGETVDHRTDQFAMGITLWELLAGRQLFDGNDEVEIAGKVMRCDVPSLGLISPERKIPPAVEGFVRRMLAPRRDERFSTTADALSALLALPAYSGDGVGLGELVRTLFHRASMGPASTLNLPELPAKVAPVRKGSVLAGKKPAKGPAKLPAGDANSLPSEVDTRTMAAREAGAARGRASSGGRPVDLTTARVRGSGTRSRARAAALAIAGGLVLVGIAVGTALLSGDRGGESPHARAPSDVEPSAGLRSASAPAPSNTLPPTVNPVLNPVLNPMHPAGISAPAEAASDVANPAVRQPAKEPVTSEETVPRTVPSASPTSPPRAAADREARLEAVGPVVTSPVARVVLPIVTAAAPETATAPRSPPVAEPPASPPPPATSPSPPSTRGAVTANGSPIVE